MSHQAKEGPYLSVSLQREIFGNGPYTDVAGSNTSLGTPCEPSNLFPP